MRSQVRKTAAIVLGALILLAPSVSMAVITFTRLTDNTFVVSHRIKGFGSRAKATRVLYEKAASLCEAAGYTHMEIKDQESEANQHDSAANATAQVKLFLSGGADRVECSEMASDEWIEQAREKLDKMGHTPPATAASASATGSSEKETAGSMSCTVEQISGMTKLGLSAAQIKAACRETTAG